MNSSVLMLQTLDETYPTFKLKFKRTVNVEHLFVYPFYFCFLHLHFLLSHDGLC